MGAGFSYGSVCSGIEAASAAWHVLGWRASWLAEIEPGPSAVLAYRWPDVPNLGDMTQIAKFVRMGLVEAPDALVGGTPCQAFSIAGLRGGLADARGQLTLTYVDLANAIDEKRGAGNECVIYWENVPGVLSDSTNAFGCFLGALAGEDSPLECAGGKWSNTGVVVGPQRSITWRVLDAQYFGVAQRRRRVFVVASARPGFDPAAVLFEFDGVRRDSAPRREAGQDVAAGTLRSTDGGCDVDHARAGHVQAVAAVNVCPTLRAGGNSTGGDRPPGTDVDTAESLLICASNGEGSAGLPFLTCSNVSKTVNNQTPLLAMAFSCKDHGADASVEIAPTLRAMGHAGSHANGGGHLAVVAYDTTQVTSPANRSSPAPGDPLAAGAHAPLVVLEPLRIACDCGHTFFGELDTVCPACRKIRGGPVTYPPSRGGAVCVTEPVTHTLKAEGFDASEDGTGRGQPIVTAYGFQPRIARNGRGDMGGVCSALTAQAGETGKGDAAPHVAAGMAVRRLSPRECERLQGFPDDYTLVPVERRAPGRRNGPPPLMADGPRYKALGNSMCVNVMRWLGMRLMVVHPEYFY